MNSESVDKIEIESKYEGSKPDVSEQYFSESESSNVSESKPDRAVEGEAVCRKGKSTNHDERWEEMFNRLLAFREEHGHCNVTSRYAKDRKLGRWVAAQRQQTKVNSTGLSSVALERASRLSEIGFEWTANNPRCVPWESRFKELLEFVVQNGHCHVPIGWEENVQLSNWVSAQRQEYKSMKKGRVSSKLNKERIDLLNSVGFIWEAQRGGLKRPRTGSFVPIPKSYDPGAASSVVQHIQEASRLLKVFGRDVVSEATLTSAAEGDRVSTDMKRCEKPPKPNVATESGDHPRHAEIPTVDRTVPSSSSTGLVPAIRNFSTQPTQSMAAQIRGLSNVSSDIQTQSIARLSDVPLPTLRLPLQMQAAPWQAFPTTNLSTNFYQAASVPSNLEFSSLLAGAQLGRQVNHLIHNNQLLSSTAAQANLSLIQNSLSLVNPMQAPFSMGSLVRPESISASSLLAGATLQNALEGQRISSSTDDRNRCLDFVDSAQERSRMEPPTKKKK